LSAVIISGKQQEYLEGQELFLLWFSAWTEFQSCGILEIFISLYSAPCKLQSVYSVHIEDRWGTRTWTFI